MQKIRQGSLLSMCRIHLVVLLLSGLEPRLLTRFDCRRYAREAYDLGVRYIGGCCGFEPYHIREIAEEVTAFFCLTGSLNNLLQPPLPTVRGDVWLVIPNLGGYPRLHAPSVREVVLRLTSYLRHLLSLGGHLPDFPCSKSDLLFNFYHRWRVSQWRKYLESINCGGSNNIF